MINAVQEETGHAGVDLKRARRRKATLIDPAKIDRLPPHSIEAEKGILGSIFLLPNESLGEAIEKFRAGPEVFYDLRHRAIYEVMVEMFDHKEAVDPITVQQRLKDRKQLDAVG